MNDDGAGGQCRDDAWRVLASTGPDLAAEISACIARSGASFESCIRSIRTSPTLAMFSDYGGAHKDARFEVVSFLVTTPRGMSGFLARRQRLRHGALGATRRMAYKSLGDKVRSTSLPEFLDAADDLKGLLINCAIDKAAAHRLSQGHRARGAFGEIGPWAARSFRKLTMVGQVAAILVEGVRSDDQDVLWVTDEDEIAPNPHKHAEAARIVGHLLNFYCTGPMGHFRFATTASDPGDLHIEDLAAVPDLAAGCLNEVLTFGSANPDAQSVQRLFVPPGVAPAKIRPIAQWLARARSDLTKVNIVVDERAGLCSVRHFAVVTDLDAL